jgi:hypothetical protein
LFVCGLEVYGREIGKRRGMIRHENHSVNFFPSPQALPTMSPMAR